ncbi:MAG: PQQ-binding-like beta-propeller repeat protein [Chloroflexi bacterium]|nr:PQQ-binding-like beta-propeller repeat protein [Chloroflexota bacterium]
MTTLLRLLWKVEADAQGLICAFTPDEKLLIAGAEDGSIYAFDRSGQLLWRQQVSGEAFRFAFSRHSNILAVGTIRGTDTSVLNFQTGELLWKFSGEAQTRAGVGVTADGERIVSGDDEGKIRCFARNGALLWRYDCNHRKISRLSVTPSGHRIVFGGNDHIYCLNGSGDLRWRYRTNGEVWAGARVLPDGSRVIGGSNDQHVYVLDDSGELIWRYRVGGNVNIAYPTPDGAFIAVGSTDSCVYLLSGDGELLWKYRTGESIYGVSLSRDAEFVAVASYDRHIYLFNREGNLLEKLRTGNQVYVVDITADGRLIGSFGFDKYVYLLENRYAARTEAERAEAHSILRQRVVGQLRRAFAGNLYHGLCYWFDQFSHLLRRNDFELCDALIAEARQEGYPLTAAEQRFVDSREGAVQLKRGIAAHRQGDFDAAEQFYRQAVAAQRKAGCPVCEEQARLALRLLSEERQSGQRDPLLGKIYNEVLVLGGSEALLTARLLSAPPEHLPLILQAATKFRLTKPLLQALKTNDRRLQMLAVATLNRFTEISDLAPITEALRHENPFIRWQAAAILSRQKKLPSEFVQMLPDLIASERDPDARRLLVEIATRLKVPNLTPLLIPLLEDSDNDLRWSVVTALGKIGDRRALPMLRKTREGYTLTELSIHDALQRAIREIEQRFPLPRLNSWRAVRPSEPELKPAKLFWRDEAVLLTANVSDVKATMRFSVIVTDQQGVEVFRFSRPYAEFASLTQRLRSELARQAGIPSSPLSGERPTEPASAYTAHEEEDEEEDDEDVELIIEDEFDEEGEDEDDEEQDEPALSPDISETHSGALWVLLQPSLTQSWRAGKFTATICFADEVTGHDEPLHSIEFVYVDDVRIKRARFSLTDSASSPSVDWAVEHVPQIYLTVSLGDVPRGTELRAQLWYGAAGSGELLIDEKLTSTTEGDITIQSTWRQSPWRVGGYTARFFVRGALALARTFEIRPYTYSDWRTLPADTPYLWDFLAQHLLHIRRAGLLVETVKDLAYLIAKTALRRPPAVEADLNLAAANAPRDAQLAALRREYRRIHHILNAAQNRDEIAATLMLWLGDVPELKPLVERHRQTLAGPRLVRWHDLPAMHPALIRTLRAHTEPVWDCAYSPDGRFLATASADQTVRVWDVQTGGVRFVLRNSDQPQYRCSFSRDGKWLVTVGRQQLHLWDAERGAHVRQIGQTNAAINAIAFHPDSRRLASADESGVIQVWDVATGNQLHRFEVRPERAASAFAFNASGSLLASVHRSGDLAIWRADLFEVIHHRSLSTHALRAVSFSPRGDLVAIGSEDGEVLLMPPESQGRVRHLREHTSAINGVAFSPDGQWLASVSEDGSLVLWNLRANGSAHLILHEHLGAVRSVAFSPDGSQLVTTSDDKDVKIWEVQRLLQRPERHPRAVPIWHGALSRDGKLALSDRGEQLVVWSMGSGLPMRAIHSAHRGDILCCAISPDGTWALSGGRDRRLRMWSLSDGRLIRTLEGHRDVIWRCAISPDGRWFASASADRSVRVWSAESGALRFQLDGHSVQVNCCAISPDGRYIASASADGTARLWSAADGSECAKLDGHRNHSVLVCTFSPDGCYLATGAYDKKINLWEVGTGRLVTRLEGHAHNVQALAFSPDGQWLLSGARDGGVRLWRLSDQTCLHSLFLDRGVTNCAFLPDRERVMVASGSGLYLLRAQFA